MIRLYQCQWSISKDGRGPNNSSKLLKWWYLKIYLSIALIKSFSFLAQNFHPWHIHIVVPSFCCSLLQRSKSTISPKQCTAGRSIRFQELSRTPSYRDGLSCRRPLFLTWRRSITFQLPSSNCSLGVDVEVIYSVTDSIPTTDTSLKVLPCIHSLGPALSRGKLMIRLLVSGQLPG